jgi:hypothetical protein
MSTATYAMQVHAHLDREMSRGLWMVKWLLVTPQNLVQGFLWLAFMVLSLSRSSRSRHRPVLTEHLRAQTSKCALDLAGGLLHLRCTRHRAMQALRATPRESRPSRQQWNCWPVKRIVPSRAVRRASATFFAAARYATNTG